MHDMQFNRNFSKSNFIFYLPFSLFLLFAGSISTFSHFRLYQIRIRIESNSVTEKFSTVGYARTDDAYTPTIRRTWHTFLCVCVSTLIPRCHIELPESISLSPLIEAQRNIRLATRRFVQCHCISSFLSFFLSISC